MKLTIGICDDNLQQVHLIKRYVNQYLKENEPVIIDSTNPEEFINRIQKNKPHIVFLDIAMGEHNGIDIGKIIRDNYENTVIIFVTAYDNYAVDAFQVRAFHYLLKPILEEKVNEVLDQALDHLNKISNKSEPKYITIKTKKEIININCDDIIYFEKIGHKVKIFTITREIQYYEKFKNLLNELDKDCFIRCHQGYIVNVNKIRSFKNNTLTLEKNLQLPVSRTFTNDVKIVFAKKLFERN